MRKDTIVLFALLIQVFVFSLNSIPVIYAQENIYVEKIDINVFYDVIDNLGFVEENITLNSEPAQVIEVDIPFIPPPAGSNGYYELLNISYPAKYKDIYLAYSIDRKTNTLKLVFNATRNIVVRYVVYNYLEEIGVGVYSLLMDLSNFSVAQSVYAKMRIIGNYTVNVYPAIGANVIVGEDVVTVELSSPQPYTLVIVEGEFGEITTPIPTTITTTTTETQAPPQQGININFDTSFLIIALALIAVALIFFLWRKRGMKIEVETIAAGDILSDETVRDIIVAIGDKGGEGVKQSDLVRITGRPKSTISRRVKRLAEEGIVEILRKGKYNIVRLTPKGQEIYENIKSKGMNKE